MKRRQFLFTAAAATTLTVGRSAFAAVATHRPLGVQLFTVMAQLEADFEGTLKALAAIGYREVETIGSFGRDPAKLRAALDRHGLVTPSQHLMPDVLYKNFLAFTRREITAEQVGAAWNEHLSLANLRPNVEDAIKKAKALGQQYVVLQIIWPDQMQSRAVLDEFCRAPTWRATLRIRGLTFNFHNHSDEMKRSTATCRTRSSSSPPIRRRSDGARPVLGRAREC
jgi:sugar phosphate isomerase/epimerase